MLDYLIKIRCWNCDWNCSSSWIGRRSYNYTFTSATLGKHFHCCCVFNAPILDINKDGRQDSSSEGLAKFSRRCFLLFLGFSYHASVCWTVHLVLIDYVMYNGRLIIGIFLLHLCPVVSPSLNTQVAHTHLCLTASQRLSFVVVSAVSGYRPLLRSPPTGEKDYRVSLVTLSFAQGPTVPL